MSSKTDLTMVRNFCHLIEPNELRRLNLKFIFLSVYVTIFRYPRKPYKICVNCLRPDTFHERWRAYHEERCYYKAEDAQKYNKNSKCKYCGVYFAKLMGESLYLFCFEGVDENHPLEVLDAGGVNLLNAVKTAYHF